MSRPTPAERTSPGGPPRSRAPSDPSAPRRLQKMGAVTVGVSLPRDWVGKRGLAAGQPVFVHSLPDGSLVLRDSVEGGEPVTATLLVNSDEPGEHLFRRLIGAYLAGATEFVLTQPGGLTQETLSLTRSFARRIGHIENVSEEGGTIRLRDVSAGSSLPAPRLLRRMFQLVHDLQVESGTSWSGALARGPSFASRDDEVDRCAWQLERQLRLQLMGAGPGAASGTDVGDALRFLLWARDLERIGDHSVLIAEHGVRLAEATPPEPIRRMLSAYHAQALAHLRAANAVAESPDPIRANEVLDVGEALHQTQTTLADRILMGESTAPLAPSAIRSLGLILQSIDRTTAYAQNLAEIGLDRALDRSTGTSRPLPQEIAEPSRSSRRTTRGRKNEG